jgi:hypothetical protein
MDNLQFILHVVDIRDAVCAERYTQVTSISLSVYPLFLVISVPLT